MTPGGTIGDRGSVKVSPYPHGTAERTAMETLTFEVREGPVTSCVRSTRGCRLVGFAFSGRDLSSFFDLVSLLLVRRGIPALRHIPPFFRR